MMSFEENYYNQPQQLTAVEREVLARQQDEQTLHEENRSTTWLAIGVLVLMGVVATALAGFGVI